MTIQQSCISRALCGRYVSGLRVELLCTTHCLDDYALEAVAALQRLEDEVRSPLRVAAHVVEVLVKPSQRKPQSTI